MHNANMKFAVIATTLLAVASSANAALNFTGNTLDVIKISPDASTGLAELYVIDNTSGVTASYRATSATATVQWYRFSNLGGAYAEEITSVTRDGATSSIKLQSGDMGYIVEENGRQYCYWVVNYADHQFSLESLDLAQEQDCSTTILTANGKGDRITYYTINGRGMELSRDLELSYRTLSYDETTNAYRQVDATETFGSLESSLVVTAPLCDTDFTLTGDRFLRTWKREVEATSPTYTTISVEATTNATQDEREVDNEIQESTSGLGGSGPCEITFSAAVTDAAIYHEWQISRSSEFETLENSYSDLEFTYTFRDNGTTYVRFIANNSEGTCEYVGQTFEVFIGESKLLCPNAFSPGSSEGVNDEWKVSYKSIVQFECNIFNRWGKKMITLTDPSQGWDGKYNGKLVPAGVYYYVITAKGSDGVRYKLSGDINIINYSGTTGSSTSDATE
jgi:gliding motility-associated-like protein